MSIPHISHLPGIMVFDYCGGTGNGYGNKFNMREKILDDLLATTIVEEGGTSAKVNSLRKVIKDNQRDMAKTAEASLDLMRRVFQPDITAEIRQVIDRHIRTTFSPAIENLRRNGHTVDERELNNLCRGMLEAAKAPYLPSGGLTLEHVTPLTRPRLATKRGYESDESDASMASSWGEVERKRHRGRPRKDEHIFSDNQPVTSVDVLQWNPDRFKPGCRFVHAAKIAMLRGCSVNSLFIKHPRVYRYSCDDEDKASLFEERCLPQISGKAYLVLLEDTHTLLGSHMREMEECSFGVSPSLLAKIRARATRTYEMLLSKMPISAYGFASKPSPIPLVQLN